MKKISVSIGIPAYNEEANIYYLLKDLFSQKTNSFKLKEVIVASDASSDGTVQLALKINRPELVVYDNKIRKGAAWVQNQILNKSNSDVLVLLNADIKIEDNYFLEKIIKPIVNGQADLTSARVLELRPESLIEKVLEESMKIKRKVFEEYKSGDNLYTCQGRARAFSKKLYKSFKFTNSVGEDAYSYLFCNSRGMKYKYVRQTCIYYKLPANFIDHQNQSVRFIHSKSLFYKKFGKNFVLQNYKLPFKMLLGSVAYYFFINPVYVSLYIGIFLLMRIKAAFSETSKYWEVSGSSKILINEPIWVDLSL